VKPFTFSILAGCIVMVVVTDESLAQRGGRGGGGGFGGARPSGSGGSLPSGFTSPARQASPTPKTQTGVASQLPAGGKSGIGPNGGAWQSGQRSGQTVTPGGAEIKYKGGAVGGTTPGGVSGGKYLGGVQITTPGGETITKVGRGGAATGPGGVTVGSKGSIGQATGPGGTVTGASRGGGAVGPGGAVAGRSGIAVGPGGVVAGRGGVAVGPGGAVAGRSGVAMTPHGTYYRSAVAVSGQGVYVRAACRPYYGYFTRAWYTQYPGAWFAAGWVASTAWRAATWSTVSSTCGYPAEPANYDYGSSVIYEEDTVYVNGEEAGTTEAYAEQATAIADAGRQTQPAKDEEWLPLGVFAMVQGEETTAYNLFQLALDKKGVIRGNYYNALTDSTEPVYGSVDKKTQRAAWTVGERKHPVYEAGIGNLAQDQTTMMVHYAKDRSQQFTLFRVEQPKAESKMMRDQK
jgi:hypothetical protein